MAATGLKWAQAAPCRHSLQSAMNHKHRAPDVEPLTEISDKSSCPRGLGVGKGRQHGDAAVQTRSQVWDITGREGPGQWMLKPRFALQLKLLQL
jgi:hypothetical protein